MYYYSNVTYLTKENLVSTAYRTRKTDNWSFKYYRYDERGRVIRIWNTIYGEAGKNIMYEYNSQDQVTHINYGDEPEYKRFSYYYDYAGRLGTLNYANADPSIDIDKSDKSAPDINFSSYTYNPNSLLDFQFFNSSRLHNQYRYNSRNWITEINSVEGVFGFTNTYFKNGNLQNQLLYGTYKDFMKNKYNLNYTYSYDNSNRLLTAVNTNQGINTYSTYNTYDKDGNILTLRRYGDNNIIADNFNYQYFPNTNKVRFVSGATDQYNYDLNGNTLFDNVNGNYDIKYDYRNLITELYHKDPGSVTRPNTYATRYYYDESGNRVRKLVYINSQLSPPSITDWTNPGDGWVLLNNEFYVKGIDGKDLAIYKGNILDEWFVWGNDIAGKIKGDKAYYYYKDHLGSVRAVVDNTGSIVAGFDYDAWGYPLENRDYNGDSIKYKYTGKELDKESFYDYFGARYYDSRIGRWGVVDPQLSNSPSFTPYNYSSDNPLVRIDPNGLDDYYFTLGSTMKSATRVENAVDRFFIQHDEGNITSDISGPKSPQSLTGIKFFETASDETMSNYFETSKYYDPSDVDVNFQNGQFIEQYNSAIPNSNEMRGDFEYALKESFKGVMDTKLNLNSGGLYVFNGKANNYREAGNIIWSSVMYHLNFSLTESRLFAHLFTLGAYQQFDQKNEQQAIFTGYMYAAKNRFSQR